MKPEVRARPEDLGPAALQGAWGWGGGQAGFLRPRVRGQRQTQAGSVRPPTEEGRGPQKGWAKGWFMEWLQRVDAPLP